MTVLLEFPEQSVNLAKMELLAGTEILEPQVKREIWEPQVNLEQMVQKENLVLTVFPETKELRVRPEMAARKENPEMKVNIAKRIKRMFHASSFSKVIVLDRWESLMVTR